MIHRTALVDPKAHVGNDVSIGPYAIIGPRVSVGDGCTVAAHSVLERNVKLGVGVKLGYGAVIGNDPQDLKYQGEETWVEVGDGTIIRVLHDQSRHVGDGQDHHRRAMLSDVVRARGARLRDRP
jgi:UDP-N-acetylglucosamine acyltransferase